MTAQGKKLYIAHGTLTAAGKGYWFTAGGEKEALGYYPHLKDETGKPMYPDTQLHGDLLFAAQWLINLGDPISPDLLKALFGAGGKMDSAKLRPGDLRYTPEGTFDQFQNKPRISIDDQTQTVEEHMLVEREYAYFGKQPPAEPQLSAKLYIGYLHKAETLKKAKELIKEAAVMLSGFGASRSRGVSRGRVDVDWQADEIIEVPDDLAPLRAPASFNYFLEALVNVRNRPIVSERSQVVATLNHITKDQLRGWFAHTYQLLFGAWPTPQQMATIQFNDLCPSDPRTNTLGFRPPVSTVVDEDNNVEDLWFQQPTDDPDQPDNDHQLIHTKKRPLGQERFVSEKGDRLLPPIKILRRMRNNMNDDFVTQDDGLFVQELIPGGTVFGGRIQVDTQDPAFAARALFILKQVKPIINGTIFAQSAKAIPPESNGQDATIPHLVTQPIPLATQSMEALGSSTNSITLTTQQRYNTALGRPRRNHIVIAPGSVLAEAQGHATLQWPGFGGNWKLESTTPPERPCEAFADDYLLKNINEIDLSRSQAGDLRGLLKRDVGADFIQTLFQNRFDKYTKKKAHKQAALYAHLLERLEKGGLSQLQAYIHCLWQALARHRRWGKDQGESNDT